MRMLYYQELLEYLHDMEEYFDQRADAEYFPDSASPVPNEEMRLLVKTRESIEAVENVIKDNAPFFIENKIPLGGK